VAKVADILIDQVKTIKDMTSVPIKTDFMVTWGLQIIDIEPIMMEAKDQNRQLRILGKGFGINKRWYWFDEVPLTYLNDKGRGVGAKEIKHDSVAEDGTSLLLTVPGSYLKDAVGNIGVTVKHRNHTAISPIDIQIGEGLKVARLKSDTGQPGDTVVIEGIGFSNIATRNLVTFAGRENQRIQATVTKADYGQLTVIVPGNIITGGVTVNVAAQTSNAKVFTVPFVVSITYGDNGNLNDDIFKLVIDGKVRADASSPQRVVGPLTIPLTGGTHKVQLIGIRAEDQVGTYYIQFGGDTLSVTGDALEGRDLLKEQVKEYTINVGKPTSPAPVKNYLSQLQQE